MRNATLHELLEQFTADCALQLAADTAEGAEIPFELVEEPGGGRRPLYCYRPLTGLFIRQRVGLLSALPTYAPAARALAAAEGLGGYLQACAEPRVPADPRERADAALRVFLGRVFAERSAFELEPARFATAYAELEDALYEGRCTSWILTPVLGLGLEHGTREIPLGDGLSLVAGETLTDAPADAIWGDAEHPHVLAVLTTGHDRHDGVPLARARIRLSKLLTALRLYERGDFALSPLAWTRLDQGAWRTVALGVGGGRPRLLTLLDSDREDELRGFCNLVAQRAPRSGEIAWALRRFELGCERITPFEALSDHLLGLRALLEPEGPGSGRLSGRLATLCAEPDQHAALAERTARAAQLERSIVAGIAPLDQNAAALAAEMAEHLRALLRDVLCGHLEPDLHRIADELLSSHAAF